MVRTATRKARTTTKKARTKAKKGYKARPDEKYPGGFCLTVDFGTMFWYNLFRKSRRQIWSYKGE